MDVYVTDIIYTVSPSSHILTEDILLFSEALDGTAITDEAEAQALSIAAWEAALTTKASWRKIVTTKYTFELPEA
jgi:hypothetical protein